MDELSDFLDDHRDGIVATLARLVRTETTNPYSGDANPSGEAAGQEVLAGLIADLGAEVELFDCPPGIYHRMGVLGPGDRSFEGRPNLVADLSLPGPGPTIVINGHMDTVGVDNMTIPPLAAEVRDGWMWGRGTSDCKGGLTIAVWALRALLGTAAHLGGRVILESVVDEECNGSGAGTLACLHRGYRGDAAVFVDGYDGRISRGCYGCLTAQVTVEGREGHAASGTGVSALEKALVIKQGVDEFKRARETLYPDARVNIGVFRAGVHPAVVPGTAEMQLNIVYRLDDARGSVQAGHPWGAGALREDFLAAVAAAAERDEWLREHPPRVSWVKDLIPFEEPEDGPWLRAIRGAHKLALGHEAVLDLMIGWTDASYYSALARVPTFLIGPSADGQAHSPDEGVEIEALLRSAKTLAAFLARALTVDSGA